MIDFDNPSRKRNKQTLDDEEMMNKQSSPQSAKQMQNNELFKNIHQLTSNLAQNKQVNIILTTNQGANTGDGEEAAESEEEPNQNMNDSCSTNDSIVERGSNPDEEEVNIGTLPALIYRYFQTVQQWSQSI